MRRAFPFEQVKSTQTQKEGRKTCCATRVVGQLCKNECECVSFLLQEGPMIHSGAVVAAGVSQGRSSTLGLDCKVSVCERVSESGVCVLRGMPRA